MSGGLPTTKWRDTLSEEQPAIEPGTWIRTEENEKLFFRRYSSTHTWGFFAENTHKGSGEFKLPLAGLKPWSAT